MRKHPNWMPDEVASAGRENLDTVHAFQYDQKETLDVETELTLLRRLGLSKSSEVVDLGAGTGQMTFATAPHCHWITAVDISPVMLEVLHRKLRQAHLPNVGVSQSGFLTYEHERRPADFVYSRLALHHLPDFWKAIALQRVRQILRPDGILRLSDVAYNFSLSEAASKLDAWCDMLSYDEPEGSWNRADIEEHIRDEHSTFIWLLEPIIEQSGFRIEEASYSTDGIFAQYVARAV